MKEQKISLLTAILININIVIGAAFFINCSNVAKQLGTLSPFAWVFVGLMLLPFVSVLSDLSYRYPVAGGMYSYPANILGNFFGFLGGFGYFIGTAAGNALVIHEFAHLASIFFNLKFFQNGTCPILVFDILLVIFFAFLNSLNVEFLGKAQIFFTAVKTIPFILLILASFFVFDLTHFSEITNDQFMNIPTTIPLVLFAYIGIEACCSISHLIEKGKSNTSKALFYSLGIIISVYFLAQLLLIGVLGNIGPFPFNEIIYKLTSNPVLIKYVNVIISFALLCSYLGGFYSMFYANTWDLYALAKADSIHGAYILKKLNRFNIPYLCLATQATMIIGLLCLTQTNELLSTMSDFGIVITYILSTIAFIVLHKKSSFYKKSIGFFSMLSCFILFYICMQVLVKNGLTYLIPFLIILLVGTTSNLLKTRNF